MIFFEPIIFSLVLYLMDFLFIRWFLGGVINYQLNTSAQKKKRKKQTRREWLLYSRFKQEIPKVLRIFYIGILLFHPVCIVAYVIASAIHVPIEIGKWLVAIQFGFIILWTIVMNLLFWSSKPQLAYSRWIKKKRGMPRKKKG